MNINGVKFIGSIYLSIFCINCLIQKIEIEFFQHNITVTVRRQRSSSPVFIHYNDRLKIDGNTKVFNNQEEIDFINDEMEKFVLSITGANTIIDVSSPVPSPGADGERVRVYRFDVETDKGAVGIYLKWLEDDMEGERFEEASKLGIAPESYYIPLGYVVSKHFEGVELSELVLQEGWITSEDNYRWLFTELGRLTAVLDKNGINYNDWGEFNIIVNLNNRKVKIIDFEDAQVRTNDRDLIFVNDIASLFNQIRDMAENLIDIDIGLRREMVQIFEIAYYEEMNKD